MNRVGVVVGIVVLAIGCSDGGVSIRYLRSETYTFTRAERRVIGNIATSTAAEVRTLLPGTPPRIEMTVRPGTDVIAEIGEGGSAMPPNGVFWAVDPSRPGGVVAVANAWLRAFLFHELHHLARDASESPRSIVEHAVFEGMATAFERDFAGVKTPWGQYPDHVSEWATELAALPADASRRHWLFDHPDGRRWIGYKVGTYWVDQAIAKTGRSSAQLVAMPTREILAFSGPAQ